MSDKRYLGNIITQNPTAPDGDFANSAAKGVWSLEEQLAYQKAGLWPVPGNFPPDVEDVFSTYLYTGNSSAQTITNGIDLDGEGGLVWLKGRGASNHHLIDTERGSDKYLLSNATNAEQTSPAGSDVTSFNSDGFSFGTYYSNINFNGYDYASWTFRKAPKFFDVVTYTGDGVDNRTIAHNLGSVPGMIIVKPTSASGQWPVYHRSLGTGAVRLNLTNAYNSANIWWKTTPTDSAFTVYGGGEVNVSGVEYVAYLFAHNDGDGGFGPDGDADIIKCGSYTGNNSANGPEIDLGFEPQWIMIKNATASQSWWMFDTMRGIVTSSNGADDARLKANASTAEDTQNRLHVTSTGFKLTAPSSDVNDSNTFIYIAIRRGTAVPESGTEVFAVDTADGSTLPQYKSGFVTDMALRVNNITSSHNNFVYSRLTQGKYLTTESTNAEGSSTAFPFDYMNGYCNLTSTDSNNYSWMWKRAPKYMDVVAYTGTGSARTVSHNLGVAPEMIWVKERDNSTNWGVYHTGLNGGTTPQDYFIRLNLSDAEIDNFTVWNDTAPTDTQFTVGLASDINGSNDKYIAYLFASLAGISKVGSVTHSGTTNVDCGFTSGARFVLLKRTDATGDWYVWDSVRGIVSGNDPYLLLNSTAAEVTNTDYIDPLSSGFTITSSFTAGDYIFYAIA
jgi:hypothetical protein